MGATLGLVGLLVAGLLGAGGRHVQALPAPTTFAYTGSLQAYSVPAGVITVTIMAVGAQGGNNQNAAGGKGASMQGTFLLPAGTTTLSVLVGGQGVTRLGPDGAGGYSGGGGGADNGVGGGGGSFLAATATSTASSAGAGTGNGSVTITPLAPTTTTTLSAAPNPALVGQPVTLTATVSAVASGSGTPTGTVSFFDGATPLGTVTLVGGVASLTTTFTTAGTHTLTAVYSGDASFVASMGTTTLTVNPAADVQISKTGPATVTAGTTLTCTLMVTNTGPSDAENVLVNDTLPTGETFVSASEGTGSGTSYSDAIGTLANGATHTLTLVAQVSASASNGSTLTNTALVSSTTGDLMPGNNTATAQTQVTVPSLMSCSVTPTVLSPTDGLLHTVTVTVTSSGSYTLQSVTSNDPTFNAATDSTFVPGTTYLSSQTTVTGSLRAGVGAGLHGRLYVLTFVPMGPAAGTACQVTVQVRPR